MARTATNSEKSGLKIGDVADRAGVGVDTVRYYERRGLIAEPPRRRSGYRAYPPAVVDLIRFIKHAQALGFTLEEIRELISLRDARDSGCDNVRALAEAKLAEIGEKLRLLQAMQRALEQLVDACHRTGRPSRCPIIESLSRPPFEPPSG